MARLTLSYEECIALRDAAWRVPPGERTPELVGALRVLDAAVRSAQQMRGMLDRTKEDDTPNPASSPSGS